MFEFSMFGDPTLVIEDGDDPKSVTVYRPILSRNIDRIINYFPALKLLIERLGQ